MNFKRKLQAYRSTENVQGFIYRNSRRKADNPTFISSTSYLKTPFQVQFLFPDPERTFHSHKIFQLKVKFLPVQEN